MAAAGSPQPNRPKAPQQAANKPLQVMKINRKDEQEKLQREAAEAVSYTHLTLPTKA